MPTIAEIRQQTGDAYSDMSDAQLADGIYKKFYSDMPREQFDSKIGLGTTAAAQPKTGEDVAAGMALRGIPIAGAYIPQAEAAIRAAAQPVTGVGEPGATWSERYAANLPKRQAEYAQAEAQQPVLSEALKFGGGMAALAPIGATAAGARALGMSGPLASRIGWGAASGAGLTAADTAARGGDPVTAGLVGGGIGAALPMVGPALGRLGTARATPQAATTATQQALEAAARLGDVTGKPVPVPRYLATEGTSLPQLAQGIRNAPFVGEPVTTSARQLTERLGQIPGEIAPGAGVPELAGERAKTGITGWIKSGSQGPVSEAYKKVDALVNPDWGTPLNNTADALHEILRVRANARIPGGSKAGDMVMQAIQSPMDYEGIKNLRTAVGPRVSQDLVGNTLAEREHGLIYRALTEDLKTGIAEGGGPQALQAWQEANSLAKVTKGRQQALSKIVGIAGDASPEAVFSRLQSYAGSKSSADIRRLRLAKNAMGPDAWNELGSAMISRLGVAPDGTFSAQRFVTAFGNMSPAARNELFSPQQHAALTDLNTVSQYVRDRITRFENVSGTSRGGISMGYLAAAFLDPISAISTVVGGRLVAHAISKPAVVRAAIQVSRASLSRDPVATQRAMARLGQIAARAGLIQRQQERPPP